MKKNIPVNKNLLRAKALEQGLTLTSVASKMGTSISMLSHKIGEGAFGAREIVVIKQILNLSMDDINRIFFDGGLA